MPVVNFEILKEPRGFIRCLEFLFSIIAFSTLANFSTEIVISIYCKSSKDDLPELFTRAVEYPFRVRELDPIDFGKYNMCGIQQLDGRSSIKFSGDFSSDAQFFVFTGVLSFLYSMFSVLVYMDMIKLGQESKALAKADFMISALVAMFWLAGSAAWANGLSQLKWVCDTSNWLHQSSICTITSHNPPTYLYPQEGYRSQMSNSSGLLITIVSHVMS